MSNKRKVKRARKAKKKKFWLVRLAALIFISAICVQLINIQSQLSNKKQELANLQQQLSNQLEENDELQKTLDTGINDEYVEKVAREKLGYVSPFERVFIDITQE